MILKQNLHHYAIKIKPPLQDTVHVYHPNHGLPCDLSYNHKAPSLLADTKYETITCREGQYKIYLLVRVVKTFTCPRVNLKLTCY